MLLKTLKNLRSKNLLGRLWSEVSSTGFQNLPIYFLGLSRDVKTGEEILFSIEPNRDNLISNHDKVSVYCKLIDFYNDEMTPQVKFLFSLLNLEEDAKGKSSAHDYTAGSLWNLISFGLLNWSYEYLKGKLCLRSKV